ncbi:MAG: nucleotidyltransferase family protein [Saprospirales bacterium]|jgi:predicted nucleotidyltransferase|nr:nucleotidyltransferase family protein [Saprospirales bacterium]
MIAKTDILDYIKRHKPELISQYHLSKIGIFGSFARGEQTPESDIDLIVEFETGTEDLYQIKQALKKLFEREFHKEVDICRERYIKPYYKKRILQDAIFV